MFIRNEATVTTINLSHVKPKIKDESSIQEEKQIAADNMMMHNTVAFGRFSYELEEKREQSIIQQSSNMLTAFSLFSAALLMALPVLIEYTTIPSTQLLKIALSVFTLLIASLVLTIIAQWRFKYKTMKTGQEFEAEIRRSKEYYQYPFQYDYQWMVQITAIHASKKLNNDRRVILIRAAMIFFITAVGVLSCAIFTYTIIYL